MYEHWRLPLQPHMTQVCTQQARLTCRCGVWVVALAVVYCMPCDCMAWLPVRSRKLVLSCPVNLANQEQAL